MNSQDSEKMTKVEQFFHNFSLKKFNAEQRQVIAEQFYNQAKQTKQLQLSKGLEESRQYILLCKKINPCDKF